MSDLAGKLPITAPKSWASPMRQRSVQRPARRSSSASSASASKRPAATSSSIWRSHATASNSANQALNASSSAGVRRRTASSISWTLLTVSLYCMPPPEDNLLLGKPWANRLNLAPESSPIRRISKANADADRCGAVRRTSTARYAPMYKCCPRGSGRARFALKENTCREGASCVLDGACATERAVPCLLASKPGSPPPSRSQYLQSEFRRSLPDKPPAQW